MEFDRETHFLIYLIGGVVLKAGQVLLRQWLAIMAEWWFASIRLNTRIRLREQGFLSQSRQLSQVWYTCMCKTKRVWPGQFQNMQNIVLKIINNQSTPDNNTWNFHCCSTMLYDYNLPWWLLHSITCTNCLSNMIIFKAVLVLLVKMAENVRVTALVSLVRAQTDFPVPIATHWLVSYWKGVKTWYIW